MTVSQKLLLRKAATFSRPLAIFLSSFPATVFLLASFFLLTLFVSAHAQQTASTKPELVLQTGHTTSISAIAFSPDGRLLASGSRDNTIKLWDVASGRELRTLTYYSVIDGLSFSPDGRWLASVGRQDNAIRIWEVATGRELRALSGHAYGVVSIAFSPDGRLLASGGNDFTVKLWEPATGRELRTLTGHKGYVNAVAFSPDGRWLASGGFDKTVKLWDVADGSEVRTLTGHGTNVSGIAFSPDGRLLVARSGPTVIWDIVTGREVRTLYGGGSVAFSPDGRWLTSGDVKGIKLWDVATGSEVRTLPITDGALAASVAFSSDGRWLALTTTGNYTIRLWDVATWGEVHRLAPRTFEVSAVTFSPDGRLLALGGERAAAQFLDVSAGNQAFTLTGYNTKTIAFSPDGRWVALGSRILDLATARELRMVGIGSRVAFSPDGRLLASIPWDNNTVKIWDVTTGRELHSLIGDTVPSSALIFSPDGRWLAAAYWGHHASVKIWDATTGRELRSMAASDPIAFSPDGRWLAAYELTGGMSTGRPLEYVGVKLWDVATGQELRNFGNRRPKALAFSPDGRWLASGGYDKKVKLWDVTTGQELRTIAGHTHWVYSVAFSPDGRLLVSGSWDGSTRIWDPQTGELLATLVSSPDGTDWMVVTPDGLFDGSPAAWNQIIWRFAGNTFDVAPVETFFNEFYYPGLLADIFAGKKPKAPKDISQLDRRQPQIKLTLAGGQSSTAKISTRTVTVKVEVAEAPPDKDRKAGSGARDVRLFRNGSLVKVWRGDVLQNKAGKVVLETTIPIIAGENRFTAYAFNRDNVKSADASLVITGAESLKRPATAYILAVGINEYANRRYNLRYAVADAQVFGEELKRQQTNLGTFSNIEVIPIFDKEATKANILTALKRLAGTETGALPPGAPAALQRIKPAQPEDAVFVYFAGHGIADRARFYLIPHDLGYQGALTQLDEAGLKTIFAHSISDLELEQAFEKVDAGKLLFVIDACNSGQALEAEEKRRGPMNSKGLAQLAYEKGMYILTAAQGYQAALEAAQFGHGLLTYALVEEGLKTPAADTAPKDGQVVVREWLDYTMLRVPQLQTAMMKEGRGRGREIAFVDGEETIKELEKRSLQHPRLFYRRDIESQPLVVAKPEEKKP